jgi:signal transduction histidine kinase
VKEFIKLILLFLIYYVSGKIGLQFSCIHSNATVIWAPSGIALAAMLLFGYRVWPAILLAAFFTNFTTVSSLVPSIAVAIGSTLEGLIGAYLVNTFAHGKNAFLRAGDIFKYTILAALLSTTIVPNIGLTTLILKGYEEWAHFPEMWFSWWMGDVAGVLIVAPFILFWAARHQLQSIKFHKLEAILSFLVLILVSLILFGGAAGKSPLTFICIPPIIWIAFRFGRRETITAIILLEIFGIWGTLQGYGPFTGYPLNESLIFFQSFMDVMAITALSLAVAIAQRRDAQLASDKIKDEFITLASHELRTPITAVNGLTSMILAGDYGPINEKLKSPLKNIHISSERQIHLINSLLDVSRLQTGKIHYQISEFSLKEVINEVISSLQPIAKHRKLKLSVKEYKDQIIQADSQWVKQVLNNLIGNALKYTEQGYVSVTIHSQNDQVHISITDSGIGIDQSDQDKLFGRFRQLHASTETKSIGSGLGLFISRGVARKMGGDIILATSEKGHGSTFTFSVPKAGTICARRVIEEIANEEKNG